MNEIGAIPELITSSTGSDRNAWIDIYSKYLANQPQKISVRTNLPDYYVSGFNYNMQNHPEGAVYPTVALLINNYFCVNLIFRQYLIENEGVPNKSHLPDFYPDLIPLDKRGKSACISLDGSKNPKELKAKFYSWAK